MAMDSLTRKALEVGRQEARKVLKRRSAALRRRATAVRKPRVARQAMRLPAVDERLRRAVGGPATAGVLVAEGDSWFDYPFNDILSRASRESYVFSGGKPAGARARTP